MVCVDGECDFHMCSRQHLKLLVGSLVFSTLVFLNPEVSNLITNLATLEATIVQKITWPLGIYLQKRKLLVKRREIIL
jgi:hypothetical protein